ncbi:MAG: hypothetical protein ACXWQQ_05680 [Pseudobdellovibrio sp.]
MPRTKSGFILVSILIQLPLMLMVLNLLFYFVLVSDLQNKILSHCYLNGLDKENGGSPTDLFQFINEETEKLNLQIQPAAKVEFLKSDSNFTFENVNHQSSRSVYILKFKAAIHFFKINLDPIEIEKTCGAEKKCANQKCRYGIITDKSL